MLLILILISVSEGLSNAAVSQEESHSIRRFALVIGANDGGKGRQKLRYAVSDAKAIINVLETMGGVSPDDSRLLMEPDRATLFWELNRLKERIARAREEFGRVEVILYYSGHSDEKNLLLGKQKVSYKEFRDAIDAMPADVRIAILDSCASGAFTRLKGGKKKKPFLMDAAYDMKGYAVMTSSSSDEASQESERLKGSFFTHYLTSGLRGAADMSQDGRITLNEVYQFAFKETLSQTEKTVSGPQHPNYNIRMSGTGDVIITDIRKSDSILRIGKDVHGKLFIHDQNQVLIAELNKAAGRTVELGLDKGKYRIINILDKDVHESHIKLTEGKTTELKIGQFKKSKKIDTVARGDLKARPRNKVLKIKGFRMNLFLDFNSRNTSLGRKPGVSGGRLGFTINKTWSVGVAAYAGEGAYAGVGLEYAFPTKSFVNIKTGLIIGSGKQSNPSRRFFVLEPEVGLTFNITKLLNVGVGISYRLVFMNDADLNPLSLNFSFRLGK
jgi:hypothetical protein